MAGSTTGCANTTRLNASSSQLYATNGRSSPVAPRCLLSRACRCRASRAAIPIAFYSGMRMAEIIRATQEDGLFKLTNSKNDSPRHVPIHPKIAAAARVTLRNGFSMSTGFKAAARAVGLGHLRFHDLRHSAASAMINADVDLCTVGAVLGHRSAQSTKRYAHLATNSLRGAIGKIGQKIPHQKKTGLGLLRDPRISLVGPPRVELGTNGL